MRKFICRKNIENYLRLLQTTLSESQRSQIEALLAAEQKNLEELQNASARTQATLRRTPVNCAADRPTGAPRRAP